MAHEGVAISVLMETHIKDGENEETVQIATNGKFFKKNNSLYLQFKENRKQIGNVNQIIKIDANDQVTVIRQGAVSMKQLFLLGKKTEGTYRSSLGAMLMETNTNAIKFEIDEQRVEGSVDLSYQLHMQHQFAGNYYVSIIFRRAK